MNMYQNERKCGLYIDMLITVRYSHEAWGRVVSVSVHGLQTQSRLLEKTHQSNGNLHKNDSVLMPKVGSVQGGGGTRACGEPSMS